MAGERTIKIKFDGEQSGLVKAADGSSRSINKMNDSVDRTKKSMGGATAAAERATAANRRVGSSFANVGSNAGLAAAGLGVAVAAWVVSTGRALQEVEKLKAQTTTVIDSMNAAWTDTSHIVGYAEQLEKLSGIEMEQVQSGQNLLLTYGNIRNEVGRGNDIFDQATSLMLDLSIATGKDMPGAANLLGKALNDPIAGLGALTKIGVQFTEQQKLQIASMVRAGNVMGAQKVILAELTRQFGGSAAAFGETTAGQVLKLQNEFGNLSEELLSQLLPTINAVVHAVIGVVGWLQDNATAVKTVAVAAAGLATTYLAVRTAILTVNAVTAAWNFIAKLATTGNITLGASFTSMSLAARIASVSMGAIGIIATVVAAGLALFSGGTNEAADRQAKLVDASRDLASALAEQNGLIDTNIRKKAAQLAEDRGLLVAAETAGVSTKEVVAGLLNENGARDKLLGSLKRQYNEMIQNGTANTKQGVALFLLINRFQDLAPAIDEATQAENRKKGAAEGATISIQDQTAALEELIKKQKEATQGVVDERSARRDLADAYDKADEAAVENGRNIDDNTEKGRANNEVLDGLRDKTFNLIEAMVGQNATTQQITATMEGARAKFIQVAIQMGYTETQAGELADKLGLLPGNYNINVIANTKAAKSSIEGIISSLGRMQTMLEVLRQANAIAPGAGLAGLAVAIAAGSRATGGPVLAGQAYRVGERGPEIFVPPNSGNIVPNSQVSGGGDTQVSVFIDGQKFRGMVRQEVKEHSRGTRRVATQGAGLAR